MKNRIFAGCLVGGALGDALGYSLLKDSPSLVVSDVTQLALFTTEGLIWGDLRVKRFNKVSYASSCFFSYQRWLTTQGCQLADEAYSWVLDDSRLEVRSPLLEENKLRAVRSTSPLFTEVLGGIKNQDYGTKESPINDRKEDDVLAFGPPVGLYFMDSPSMAFRVASEIAAMIYGNPTAYLSVGLFAAIISLVASGSSILEAVPHALSILGGYHGSREVYDTVILALEKGKKKNTLEYADHHSTAATTLARGIYDVLLYEENYEEAIILAIQGKRKNQIGYICGCLLGLKLGLDEIPKDAVESIDCIDIILKMSDKLGISYENKLYIT